MLSPVANNTNHMYSIRVCSKEISEVVNMMKWEHNRLCICGPHILGFNQAQMMESIAYWYYVDRPRKVVSLLNLCRVVLLFLLLVVVVLPLYCKQLNIATI